MTNYTKVFDEQFYLSIAKKAATYFLETGKTAAIPSIGPGEDSSIKLNSKKYRHRTFGEVKGVGYASLEIAEEGVRADTVHNWADYDLFFHRMDLEILMEDRQNFGDSYVLEKKDAETVAFADEIDNAQLHGPLTAVRGTSNVAKHLAQGIIGQVTSVQDLNGTNSTLTNKGDGYKAIKKLMGEIPFRYRENAPKMLVYMDPTFYGKMTDPDRIYLERNEWDLIYEDFFTDKAPKGFRCEQPIITEKILGILGDTVADDDEGEDIAASDTSGTHSRLMVLVPDKRIVARVNSSNGIYFVGEKSGITNIHQLYGYRGRACVFDSNGVKYSEQIKWA